jgi:hypothetical protein
VALARVSDSNVFEIWKRIDGDNAKRVHVVKPKYKLGQHVRISKGKMRFAKGLNRITARKFLNFQK